MNRHFSPLIPDGKREIADAAAIGHPVRPDQRIITDIGAAFEDWWTEYANKISTASDLEKAAARAAWDYLTERLFRSP